LGGNKREKKQKKREEKRKNLEHMSLVPSHEPREG
jgi:hypothetical protein